MNSVFLIQNQDHDFLDRNGEWVRGDNKSLYRTPHRDEAINTKVEFSVKRPELRLSIYEAELGPKGELKIEESVADHPPATMETATLEIDDAANEGDLFAENDVNTDNSTSIQATQ